MRSTANSPRSPAIGGSTAGGAETSPSIAARIRCARSTRCRSPRRSSPPPGFSTTASLDAAPSAPSAPSASSSARRRTRASAAGVRLSGATKTSPSRSTRSNATKSARTSRQVSSDVAVMTALGTVCGVPTTASVADSPDTRRSCSTSADDPGRRRPTTWVESSRGCRAFGSSGRTTRPSSDRDRLCPRVRSTASASAIASSSVYARGSLQRIVPSERSGGSTASAAIAEARNVTSSVTVLSVRLKRISATGAFGTLSAAGRAASGACVGGGGGSPSAATIGTPPWKTMAEAATIEARPRGVGRVGLAGREFTVDSGTDPTHVKQDSDGPRSIGDTARTKRPRRRFIGQSVPPRAERIASGIPLRAEGGLQ